MAFIRTPGGLHISLNGKIQTLAKTDSIYGAVVAALARGAADDEILKILSAELIRLEKATQVAPDIVLKDGDLLYKGEAIAGTLGTRMQEMLNEGFSLKPMSAMLANLMLNPSNKVVTRLYEFLEKGKNPLTEDGHFLAYKAVRPDFKDIHSAKFDNSVGQVLSMPRNRVDERDEVTCSDGFHVCSFEYLPHFSHAGGHVMICKVSPADVVSIPTDYGNTKMRVCRYEVVGEYEGYYTERTDVLASTTVVADSDAPFLLEISYSEEGDWFPHGAYPRLVEAAHELEDLLDDTSIFSARLTNVETGSLIQEKLNEGYKDEVDDPSDARADEYTLVGFLNDGSSQRLTGALGEFAISDGETYKDVPSAVTAAWERVGEFVRIQVLDQDGNVEVTIS
jgi:hypothetical protein